MQNTSDILFFFSTPSWPSKKRPSPTEEKKKTIKRHALKNGDAKSLKSAAFLELLFSDFPICLLWNCCLRGQGAQVYLRKIFILQKRALRLMFFAGNRSHAISLFVSANVLPLNMLYFETVCSLLHNISTSSAPQNICDLFTRSSDVHLFNLH